MIVNIYDVDQNGTETFRCRSDLLDCYPDDVEAREAARNNLQSQGRHWEGGGAMELTLLMLVRS